ncbi:MAG: hypothetical protein JSV09_01415, partial [Thermoplasmata archaeon]
LSFLFEVENTGTDTDDYNIRVDSISTETGGDTSLWITAISFNPTIISNLAPGQIIMITMYVDIPFPSDLSLIPPRLYNITVEVSSASDTDIKDTQVFTVDVQKYYWADIQDSVTTKNVDVGSSVVYSITIKNKGNDFDLLSVELEGDPAIPGSVNWGRLTHVGTSQIDKQVLVDIPLNSGESTDIELRITIPQRTDPGYPSIDPDDVTLTVIVRPSDENGVDDQVSVTADINPIYEFDFNFLAQTLDVNPGETALFTLNIENKGTASDTFTPDVYIWEQDWSSYGYIFSPQFITIPPGNIGEVTFTLNTPSDMEEAESRDYNITIRVHSTTGDTDLFEICTVHIEPVYDVELTITDQTSKSVNVGDSVTYQFSIKNTGNIHETFQFNVIDMDTSPGGGGDQYTWVDLYLQSAPSTPVNSIYLSYGERETMILEISIPNQGDPNFAELSAPLDIKIEASPQQEPSVKDSFITSTTVNPIYSFELKTTAPGNKKSGEPGDTVSFTLQVRNIGTIVDTYEFWISSVDESIFTVPNPNDISNLDVDSYGTTQATITITSDNSKALEGTYQIEIRARSQGDPMVVHTLTLNVEITPLGDVELTPSSQTGDGEPGDILDYVVRITNKGNAEDSFVLTLEGTYKHWAEILSISQNPISQVTLSATDLPGYFTDIIVRVEIPQSGETNASQSYPITTKASSTNTDGVFDTAMVTTAVEELVDLQLDYAGSGLPEKDYDPNKQAPKITFRVTNYGNIDESNITANVKDIPSTWDWYLDNPIITLEPGTTTTFSITFDIPSEEFEGEFNLQVYVTSSDGTFDSDPVNITINIIKPDLSVSGSDISGLSDVDLLKSKIGNAVTIIARIHNFGHSKAENIQVKLYESNIIKGTKTISSIDAGGYKDLDFRWTVVAEETEIKVEITPIEEIDLGNNVISPILLDLRPDLTFTGEKLNFSNTNP